MHCILCTRIILHIREASWKGSLGVEVDGITEQSTFDRAGPVPSPSALVFARSNEDTSLSKPESQMEIWFGAGREFGVGAGTRSREVDMEIEMRGMTYSEQ